SFTDKRDNLFLTCPTLGGSPVTIVTVLTPTRDTRAREPLGPPRQCRRVLQDLHLSDTHDQRTMVLAALRRLLAPAELALGADQVLAVEQATGLSTATIRHTGDIQGPRLALPAGFLHGQGEGAGGPA